MYIWKRKYNENNENLNLNIHEVIHLEDKNKHYILCHKGKESTHLITFSVYACNVNVNEDIHLKDVKIT